MHRAYLLARHQTLDDGILSQVANGTRIARTIIMLTDDSLHGRAVLSKDGLKLGHVTHVLLEPQGFRIAALEIRVSREVASRAGISAGLLRGPSMSIPTEQIQSIGDAVILNVALEELRELSSPREHSMPADEAPR